MAEFQGRLVPTEPESQGTFLRNIVLACFAMLFFFTYTIDSWLDAQLMLFSLLMFFLIALPLFLRRSISPAEPIALMIPLLLMGVCMKLAAIVAYGFDHPVVAGFLLNGRDSSILVKGSFAMLIGIGSYTLGYLGTNRPLPISVPAVLAAPSWSPSRTRMVLFFLVSTSGLATLMMLSRFGISGFADVSEKRFNDLEGGAQSRFVSLNYWLFRVSLLGRFALYLWVPHAQTVNRNKRRIGYIVLFLIATIPPIIVSNRAGLGLIFADILLIRYFQQGKIKLRTILVGGAVSFVIVLALLASRSGNTSVSELAESTILGRDFLDVTKTSHILSFTEAGVFEGETYYGWPFVLVPDGMWEGKPQFATTGRYVWSEAYSGTGINGVPAGLIGEAWLNLGWFGIIVVPAFVGMALRKLFLTLRPYFKYSNASIIYSMTVIRFGIFAWSNDIGTGILKTVLDVVPMLILLRFVSVRDRRSSSAARTSERLPAVARGT